MASAIRIALSFIRATTNHHGCSVLRLSTPRGASLPCESLRRSSPCRLRRTRPYSAPRALCRTRPYSHLAHCARTRPYSHLAHCAARDRVPTSRIVPHATVFPASHEAGSGRSPGGGVGEKLLTIYNSTFAICTLSV